MAGAVNNVFAAQINAPAGAPVVETVYGKIRGRILNKVNAFQGIAQKAPVYMYYFTWQSPVREGKLKSFHTLEIPFVLENVDEAKSMTGDHPRRYALQDRMSAAWAAIARTGNPNHKDLPAWPPFNTNSRATMIFDNICTVANDPHREERLALASLRRT